METCIFCKPSTLGRIFDLGEDFYGCFDVNPVTPRHFLIIPKKHIVSLFDLNQRQWKQLRLAIHLSVNIIETIDIIDIYQEIIKGDFSYKIKQSCKETLESNFIQKKPDAYNMGNNDGIAAGRTIHHFHYHIIPRYIADVEDPRGGIRHVIPDKGNYKKE